jgi:hypothetical protein
MSTMGELPEGEGGKQMVKGKTIAQWYDVAIRLSSALRILHAHHIV